MNQNQINEWVMENSIKVIYNEKYNEEVSLGDVIDSSVEKDDILEAGNKITITISKGKLEMPKIESIDSFKIWASENKINYQVNYDFSDTVKSGNIIKCSHNTGDAIKENDTVVITVSKGKSITVINFVGMKQDEAKSKCSSLGLSCTIREGSYNDKYSKGCVCKYTGYSSMFFIIYVNSTSQFPLFLPRRIRVAEWQTRRFDERWLVL